MSTVISSESFRKIEPLMPGNYGSLYAQMSRKLTPDELAVFARPDNPHPNMGQWINDLNVRLRPYSEADERQKEEIAVYLEKMKRQITPKLAANANFKNVFEIPTTDQIFWWRDEDGRVRCMLAQWGFQLFNTPENVNVIDKLIQMPRRFIQTEVIVHVRYSDGLPASRATFKRFMFNAESDFTTDDHGDCNFGQMMPGLQFSVYNSNRRFDYEVLNDVNDYNAEFDFLTSYRINVVNQFDEPMPNFDINIDSQRVRTNAEGAVEVSGVVLTPNKVIKVTAEGASPAEFPLKRDPQSNVFTFKIAIQEKTDFDIKVVNQDGMPKANYPLIVNGQQMTTGAEGMVRVRDWAFQRGDKLNVMTQEGRRFTFDLAKDPAQNHFIIELRDPIFTGYTIRVVNQRGEPKVNYPINVDSYQFTTNEQGIVIGENVPWEEGASINVSAQGGVAQRFTLERNPNSNNFIYQIQEIFPQEQKVRIKVLDYDKTPLDNLMVSIKARDGQRLTAMTDNEGYVEFPATAFTDGKKTKVEFTVTKQYRKNLEERKKQQRQANRNGYRNANNNPNPNNPNPNFQNPDQNNQNFNPNNPNQNQSYRNPENTVL